MAAATCRAIERDAGAGLDARAAAIVMRTVRSIVSTGRCAGACWAAQGNPPAACIQQQTSALSVHPDACTGRITGLKAISHRGHDTVCSCRTIVCTIHQPSIDIFEVGPCLQQARPRDNL